MIFASNFNINTNQRNLVLFQVHYLMYVYFGILWGFQLFWGEIGGRYQNLRVIYFINLYYLDPMDQTQLKILMQGKNNNLAVPQFGLGHTSFWTGPQPRYEPKLAQSHQPQNIDRSK